MTALFITMGIITLVAMTVRFPGHGRHKVQRVS